MQSHVVSSSKVRPAAADTQGMAAPVVLPNIRPSYATAQVLESNAESKVVQRLNKDISAGRYPRRVSQPQQQSIRRTSDASSKQANVTPHPPVVQTLPKSSPRDATGDSVPKVIPKPYIPDRKPPSFFHEERPPPPVLPVPCVLASARAPLNIISEILTYALSSPEDDLPLLAQLATVCRRWRLAAYSVHKSITGFPILFGRNSPPPTTTDDHHSLWNFLTTLLHSSTRGQHVENFTFVQPRYHSHFFAAEPLPTLPIWCVLKLTQQLLYVEHLDLRGVVVKAEGSGGGGTSTILEQLSNSKTLVTLKLDGSFFLPPHNHHPNTNTNTNNNATTTATGHWCQQLLTIPNLKHLHIGHKYTLLAHDDQQLPQALEVNVEVFPQLIERLHSFVCNQPLSHKSAQMVLNATAPQLEKLQINLMFVRASLFPNSTEGDISKRLPVLKKLTLTHCVHLCVIFKTLIQFSNIITLQNIKINSAIKGKPVWLDKSYIGTLLAYTDVDSEPTTPRAKAKKAVVMQQQQQAPKAQLQRRASTGGRRMSMMPNQQNDMGQNLLQAAVVTAATWEELGEYSAQVALLKRPTTKRSMGKKGNKKDKDDDGPAVNRPEFPFEYGMSLEAWDTIVQPLQTLRMVDVGISTVSSSWNIGHIRVLDLSRNYIQDPTPLFVQLSESNALQVLNLSHNEINHIGNEIGKLTSLTEVSLNNNELNKLPAAMGHLSNLTSLNLAANKLKSMPAAIPFLTKLQRLTLDNNDFSALPDNLLTRCVKLQYLSLSNTKLKVVPGAIRSLVNLHTLLLKGCQQLQQIAVEVFGLPELSVIDLRNAYWDNVVAGTAEPLWEFCKTKKLSMQVFRETLFNRAEQEAQKSAKDTEESEPKEPA